MERRQAGRHLVWIVTALAVGAGAGCETLEKKFTRKPKGPRPRPTPVIQFQDYSRSMTPLDRYRKHYMIFDYWNSELIDALQGASVNPKRYKRASQDALNELVTMHSLLTEDKAAALGALIQERTVLDRQLQAELIAGSRMALAARTLEMQARKINRNFFWRDVQDALKPQEAVTAPAEAQADTPGDAATP